MTRGEKDLDAFVEGWLKRHPDNPAAKEYFAAQKSLARANLLLWAVRIVMVLCFVLLIVVPLWLILISR